MNLGNFCIFFSIIFKWFWEYFIQIFTIKLIASHRVIRILREKCIEICQNVLEIDLKYLKKTPKSEFKKAHGHFIFKLLNKDSFTKPKINEKSLKPKKIINSYAYQLSSIIPRILTDPFWQFFRIRRKISTIFTKSGKF